ncbi:Ldh family oxidoreductase [Virgibacillus profundi]|uniref:Ldh family oxidoreductase n=1 Tax=Virgibacillus profundi TaxID=2024555 RepID=UPI0013FD2980|nr:Ldh family oxidoreductase [Virgibacillus profundi]
MIKIQKENHNQLIIDILTKVGLSNEQAEMASKIMNYADIRGIDSHGLILLKTYVERIRNKIISKEPIYKWFQKTTVISLLDGDHGIGHFLGNLAMEEAIKTAKKNSLGLVLVKNATHYGASGYYTELAAKHGMIGITTTNTMPLMAPTGGAERVLGNNPISFSVPREGEDPVVVDIATSVVAAGKLILQNQKNEPIPEGWALDKNGKPTTDPFEGYEGGGTLLPIGNHKGYALSFIMDVLAGVLSGSGYGKKVGHSDIGFIMMAIDIEQIMPREQFNIRLDDFITMVKGAKKANKNNSIYLPGEIEYSKKKEREKHGVTINENLYKELKQLISDLELSVDQYF